MLELLLLYDLLLLHLLQWLLLILLLRLGALVDQSNFPKVIFFTFFCARLGPQVCLVHEFLDGPVWAWVGEEGGYDRWVDEEGGWMRKVGGGGRWA